MFTEIQNKQWCKMGPRAMFGQFMIDLVKKNKKLMIISADLGRSSGLDRFKKEFPKNYISVGISEQNIIGVASGLSREGFKVFVTSPLFLYRFSITNWDEVKNLFSPKCSSAVICFSFIISS